MARGWESKSVESQQDADRPQHPQKERTLEERQRETQRRGIELSLARVRQQLLETESPVRREALESARQHLENELRRLAGEG